MFSLKIEEYLGNKLLILSCFGVCYCLGPWICNG